MVDKNKLKNFLKSDYSESVKLLALNALKGIMDFPTDNSHLALFLYDLDLFEDGFITLPKGQYYIIDFYYLEKLSTKIKQFYIGMLIENSVNLQRNIAKTTLLIEHGILISNIEHLKLKRQQKLDELEARKLLNEPDDCDGFDCFDF